MIFCKVPIVRKILGRPNLRSFQNLQGFTEKLLGTLILILFPTTYTLKFNRLALIVVVDDWLAGLEQDK